MSKANRVLVWTATVFLTVATDQAHADACLHFWRESWPSKWGALLQHPPLVRMARRPATVEWARLLFLQMDERHAGPLHLQTHELNMWGQFRITDKRLEILVADYALSDSVRRTRGLVTVELTTALIQSADRLVQRHPDLEAIVFIVDEVGVTQVPGFRQLASDFEQWGFRWVTPDRLALSLKRP